MPILCSNSKQTFLKITPLKILLKFFMSETEVFLKNVFAPQSTKKLSRITFNSVLAEALAKAVYKIMHLKNWIEFSFGSQNNKTTNVPKIERTLIITLFKGICINTSITVFSV